MSDGAPTSPQELGQIQRRPTVRRRLDLLLLATCSQPKALMTIDSNTSSAERAARQANGDAAKADSLKALADLDATADGAQQAAHIRGVVATTMAHLTADATEATRESAAQWETWALGLSDALVPAQIKA
jgi:hypothetical protein